MNKQKLLKLLKNREARQAFTEEAVDVGIPIQVREMRKARKWTQKQLGEIAGVAQEAVARTESLSYGRFTLATLKNLAAAFDCALIVRFAPFSELMRWRENLDSADVTPPDYAMDEVLHQEGSGVAPDVIANPSITSTISYATDKPLEISSAIEPAMESLIRPEFMLSQQGSPSFRVLMRTSEVGHAQN